MTMYQIITNILVLDVFFFVRPFFAQPHVYEARENEIGSVCTLRQCDKASWRERENKVMNDELTQHIGIINELSPNRIGLRPEKKNTEDGMKRTHRTENYRQINYMFKYQNWEEEEAEKKYLA